MRSCQAGQLPAHQQLAAAATCMPPACDRFWPAAGSAPRGRLRPRAARHQSCTGRAPGRPSGMTFSPSPQGLRKPQRQAPPQQARPHSENQPGRRPVCRICGHDDENGTKTTSVPPSIYGNAHAHWASPPKCLSNLAHRSRKDVQGVALPSRKRPLRQDAANTTPQRGKNAAAANGEPGLTPQNTVPANAARTAFRMETHTGQKDGEAAGPK